MIRSIQAPIYQCKITLCKVSPPIWRRFQVRSDITLSDLHEVLQMVMGWENCHLYEFSYGKQRFGEPDDEYTSAGIEITDSEKVTFGQVIDRVEEKFNYRYDFGDGWRHEIEVEKIFYPDKALSHPICLEGARACPPEDCGGTWGYEELLEALKNPDHKDHERLTTWVGGHFDPEVFDLEQINKHLKKLKR